MFIYIVKNIMKHLVQMFCSTYKRFGWKSAQMPHTEDCLDNYTAVYYSCK